MRSVLMAAALLGSAGSAGAATYVGELRGSVTSQFATEFTAADAAAGIKVGDTIVARFSYVKSEAGEGSLAEAMGWGLASLMTDQVSFELAGHRWTSRGNFLGGLAPLAFGPANDPFRDLYLTTDDAPGAGDLHVEGYGFEIGEFGYDLYQGFGYKGAFDLASLTLHSGGDSLVGTRQAVAAVPVPEPAAWALMISGFGLIGGALRRRKASVSYA